MDLHAFYLRNKFWINDFLHGSSIGAAFRELRQFDRSSHEACEELRQRKLERLLNYAVNNSIFYKNNRGGDLYSFPIMSKQALIEHYGEIAVAPEKIPGQQGDIFIQSTSGSSGTPLHVPQDTCKRRRRISELKYFGQKVGFKSHEVLVHLRVWNKWQSKTKSQIYKENIFPFDTSVISDERLEEVCSMIQRLKAVSLRGDVSVLDMIARHAIKKGYRFSTLKVVITGSETLHDDARARCAEAFNCQIVDQYANEECGILAQNRIPVMPTDNKMYLNHADYIFECLKLNSDVPAEYGEIGRLVVTDLHNYAFPMIRYDTGDTAVFLAPDDFSNGYPVMGKLFGRRFDMCTNTRGEFVYPLSIGKVLKHYDKVLQWQFIQTGEKAYTLKAVLKEEKSDYLDGAIVSLKETFGTDAEIQVELVENIPRLTSGKHKPVINAWNSHI